jgi:hypothetical protein
VSVRALIPKERCFVESALEDAVEQLLTSLEATQIT